MVARAVIGAAAVLAVGCFSPSVREGLPCGPPPDNACPAGQTCQADGTCHGDGEIDASGGADARETIDSPPGTPDARPDAATGWTVTLIPELASPSEDQDPSMRLDGLEIVWSSDRPGGLGGGDIWHATRASVSEPFTNIEPLTSLNSTSDDQSPEIGRTGLSFYFVSMRNGTRDVWSSFRATLGEDFPAPTLVTGLSTSFEEANLSVHANLIAVIDRTDASGDRDLYLADRGVTSNPWPAGNPISEVNTTAFYEGSPFISGDDLTLYFHRVDPALTGHYQIFVATRPSVMVPFEPPQPMFQPDDSDPWASDDGKTMLISRGGDIYLATQP